MSLVTAVQNLVSERANDEAKDRIQAGQYIVGIAVRELTHQTLPNDADDLLEALAEANLTLDHYRDIVESATRIRHLQARLENAQALASERVHYRAKLKQQQRIAERLIAEAQAEYSKREQANRSIAQLQAELDRLAKTYPFFFEGVKPVSAIKTIELPPERVVIKPTHTCEFCGAKFNSDDPSQKFCSYRCNKDAATL